MAHKAGTITFDGCFLTIHTDCGHVHILSDSGNCYQYDGPQSGSDPVVLTTEQLFNAIKLVAKELERD